MWFEDELVAEVEIHYLKHFLLAVGKLPSDLVVNLDY
jgi:hypothetical protein